MADAHYKMAAVVRLTGIPANTLRTWERRYDIVTPNRSAGGARLYLEDDVTRLQLISALLECGEAIGALAGVSSEDLRERLATHRRATVQRSGTVAERASLAVFGQSLASQLRAATSPQPIEVVVPFDGGGFEEFMANPVRVDALLISHQVLGTSPVGSFRKLMEASGARLGIVVYEFASTSALWRLTDAGARLVRGPTRIASLLQIVQDQLALETVREYTKPFSLPSSDEVRPERYFSDSQLGWLKEARNGIDCECPNHLSSLVEALSTFEEYSVSCENRNEDDAALHAALALGAARARAQLELMLQRVIEADNLALPGE